MTSSKKKPASHTIIKISDLCVTYDRFTALEGVNLDIKSGECFGIMGGNGAGKTTLIKTIIGLRQQKSGDIVLYGVDGQKHQGKRDIAFLPERFEPPWFLTGEEFIAFSLRLYNQPYRAEELYEYAEQIGLQKSALNARVDSYSKGMRQKLGILATILTQCDLMIFDEPMSGLDPLARLQVKVLLQTVRKQGRTCLICSHILADMEELCDRVGLVHNKTLSVIDSPKALMKKSGSKTLEHAFLELTA